MTSLNDLLARNRAWSKRVREQDPEFFARLVARQTPEYLWIGCSDSRVPANEIIDLPPGDVFVHRNVANLVVPSDLNCLSVMQFAVDVLKVKHVLVVGHYSCGGVKAVMQGARYGLVDNWLHHVQDVRNQHSAALEAIHADKQLNLLCELNVLEQALNVCDTTVMRDAWARGQQVAVHAWVYGLHDGCVRDLGMTVERQNDVKDVYAAALQGLLR